MDEDDDTTYINNTSSACTISSITLINNNMNGPDPPPPPHRHQYQQHLPFQSASSTSYSVTHTTISHSKPINMEEVWNDLNLVPLNEGLSLNNNSKTPPNTSTVFGVHDFLGRSNDTRNLQCSSNIGEINRSVFCSHDSQMQQQQQLSLGPALNLNSSPGLEFLVDNFDPLVISSNSDQIMIQPNPISSVGRVPPHEDHRLTNDDYGSPFQALASATRLNTVGKRRLHENVAERRRKRRIKNRESAARSRARREAYTNELEMELSHLLSENSKLKKQHEQLRLVVDAQVAGRHVLHRASTAPF